MNEEFTKEEREYIMELYKHSPEAVRYYFPELFEKEECIEPNDVWFIIFFILLPIVIIFAW